MKAIYTYLIRLTEGEEALALQLKNQTNQRDYLVGLIKEDTLKNPVPEAKELLRGQTQKQLDELNKQKEMLEKQMKVLA